MKEEKRGDVRMACTSCLRGELYPVASHTPVVFYYSNISARGICAFCLTFNCLKIGDIIYLIRNQTKKVISRTCWVNRFESDTSLIGLNILNNNQECDNDNNYIKNLLRANHEFRRSETTETTIY